MRCLPHPLPYPYPSSADAVALFLLSSEERVRNGAAKLQKMLNAKQQGRLDGFFKVLPKADKPESSTKGAKGAAAGAKRKVRTHFSPLFPFEQS